MTAAVTQALRPLIAGNWKMNGLKASLPQVTAIRDAVAAQPVDCALCLPATLIAQAADLCRGSRLIVGAQNCHADAAGAHTGELSAEMLKDAGATMIILGHSERRQEFGETDEMVAAKVRAALRANLDVIVCLGETKEQRERGQTLEVVARQLQHSIPSDTPSAQLTIAYEPVWAIGSGLTPTTEDIAEVHAFIRTQLAHRLLAPGPVKILYGGSVKPENAAPLMAVEDVHGALVGGASLKAHDFLKIVEAYR
jgi:triosephosphate isomerase (TIM)